MRCVISQGGAAQLFARVAKGVYVDGIRAQIPGRQGRAKPEMAKLDEVTEYGVRAQRRRERLFRASQTQVRR